VTAISRVQEVVFTGGQGKAQGRCAIIKLGNIHVKWKLLIERTCVLPVNDNMTVWIRTLLGVHSQVTNKGEIYNMGGTGIAKLK
jgi:hypothetical protein